ncbi:MAG: hypothetical protein ACKOAH_04445, partial [Pirellula sp.]
TVRVTMGVDSLKNGSRKLSFFVLVLVLVLVLETPESMQFDGIRRRDYNNSIRARVPNSSRTLLNNYP